MAVEIINKISESHVINTVGDSYQHNTLSAGPYTVSVKLSVQPGSALIVNILQNGSPKVVSSAPAASQISIDVQIELNCALNDTLLITLGSSAAVDNNMNAVKGILNIRQGNV